MTEQQRKDLEAQRPELQFTNDDILELWLARFWDDIDRQWPIDAVSNIVQIQLTRSIVVLINEIRDLDRNK